MGVAAGVGEPVGEGERDAGADDEGGKAPGAGTSWWGRFGGRPSSRDGPEVLLGEVEEEGAKSRFLLGEGPGGVMVRDMWLRVIVVGWCERGLLVRDSRK